MPDLSTTYMGLNLKNPIIVGSSDLTSNIESLKELEKNGAAAVVLNSLFEEEILHDISALEDTANFSNYQTEAYDYIKNYIESSDIDKYLQLIEDAKNSLSIPVIASINCVTSNEWTTFAKKIEDHGADALELNVYIVASDISKKSENIEAIYFDILEKVKKTVSIPVSVKLSPYFSSLANTCFNLYEYGASALVLFNSYVSPDIDINNFKIITNEKIISPHDYTLPLRWIGILANKIKCDLSMTTGVNNGTVAIKALLAGAKTVEVVSALYNDITAINTMLKEIEEWMTNNNFETLDSFRGKLSQTNIDDHSLYERFQFMTYI